MRGITFTEKREADIFADGIGVARVLRCRKTHLYFTGHSWSEEPEQGKNFPHVLDAVRECVEMGMVDVELVLRPLGGATELFSTPIR